MGLIFKNRKKYSGDRNVTGIQIKYAQKQTDTISIEAGGYGATSLDFSDIVGADEVIINATVTTTNTYYTLPMFMSISQRSVYVGCKNLSDSSTSTKWTIKILYVKGTLVSGT